MLVDAEGRRPIGPWINIQFAQKNKRTMLRFRMSD